VVARIKSVVAHQPKTSNVQIHRVKKLAAAILMTEPAQN
jgi:hypothetical protein